jgi:hypothetical protein
MPINPERPYALNLTAYEYVVLKQILSDAVKTVHPFDVRVTKELLERPLVCPDCNKEHHGVCD